MTQNCLHFRSGTFRIMNACNRLKKIEQFYRLAWPEIKSISWLLVTIQTFTFTSWKAWKKFTHVFPLRLMTSWMGTERQFTVSKIIPWTNFRLFREGGMILSNFGIEGSLMPSGEFSGLTFVDKLLISIKVGQQFW